MHPAVARIIVLGILLWGAHSVMSYLAFSKRKDSEAEEQARLDDVKFIAAKALVRASPPATLASAENMLGAPVACFADDCLWYYGKNGIKTHTEKINGEYRKGSPVHSVECMVAGESFGPCR